MLRAMLKSALGLQKPTHFKVGDLAPAQGRGPTKRAAESAAAAALLERLGGT